MNPGNEGLYGYGAPDIIDLISTIIQSPTKAALQNYGISG